MSRPTSPLAGGSNAPHMGDQGVSQPEKRLLDAREAACYLGLSESTLRQWACQGRIPKVKLRGKALRFDKSDLDQIIAADKSPARCPD